MHFLVKQCLVVMFLTHITFCSDKKTTFSPKVIKLLQQEFNSINRDLNQIKQNVSSTSARASNLNSNLDRQQQLLKKSKQDVQLQLSLFIDNQERQEVTSVTSGMIDQIVYKDSRKGTKQIKKTIVTPILKEIIEQAVSDSLNKSRKIIATTPHRSAIKAHTQTQQQVIDSLKEEEYRKKAAFHTEILRMNAVIYAGKKQAQLNKTQPVVAKLPAKKNRIKNRKKSSKDLQPSFYDYCCIS